MLRDTQVNAIWEGTTNILSLDVLRAVNKSSRSVLGHFRSDVLTRIHTAREFPNLQEASSKVEKALREVLQAAVKLPPDCVEMAAREFAYSLSRIYIGALLIEHAAHHEATPSDVYTALKWCERDLSPLCTHEDNKSFSQEAQKQNLQLVFDGYPEKSRL
uniref:Acyl-CoA dehydrogenase 11-like C-terminal domain-containing protein n=1 Tax=Arion vulgaris TaxID=1028688 RepID=A0A0B6ZTS2_9EUPU